MSHRTIWFVFLGWPSLSACDDPFLRNVADREPPNDLQSCAPDGDVVGLLASVHDEWVALAFEESATDEDGVLIERGRRPGLEWNELVRLAKDSEAYNDYSAKTNRRYVYRAKTYRLAGAGRCDSAGSEEVEVITFPQPVDELRVHTVSPTSAELRWLDSNDYATGFRIERQTFGEGFTFVAEVSLGEHALVDGDLEPGWDYDYRIMVVNDSGPSLPVVVSRQSAEDPQLSWSGEPYLEDDCTLVSPGDAEFDIVGGASFLSASATVVGGGISATATVGPDGVAVPLSEFADGVVDASWSVLDSTGGFATITRDLTLSTETVVRRVTRRPTRSLGDDATAGRQGLRPGCSRCSGPRGMVSAGLGPFTCTLSEAGQVGCWGWNYHSQMGRGDILAKRLSPLPVCSGDLGQPCASQLRAIDLAVPHASTESSSSHSCARTPHGEVSCWGLNDEGQLGDGTQEERHTPAPVCASGTGVDCPKLTGVRGLALGQELTCARMSSGRVRCWGRNDYGQTGTGTTGGRLLGPALVCEIGTWNGQECAGGTPLEDVTALVAGERFVCALTGAGSIKCWGYNYYGQLGDGTDTNRRNPVEVCASGAWVEANGQCEDGGTPSALTGVASLGTGRYHACAVMEADGAVRCWGYNYYGQLGTGSTADNEHWLPVEVCAISSGVSCEPLLGVRRVALGAAHTCALTESSAQVLCWGDSGYGRLGNGDGSTDHANPVPVCSSGSGPDCPPLVGVRSIAATSASSCAIVELTGELWCWGYNSNGVLGSGDEDNRLNPTRACRSGTGVTCEPLARVAVLGLAANHACVLLEGDGEANCWGNDGWAASGFGKLGISVADRQRHMRNVCGAGLGTSCEPLGGMRALSVGANHACAIDASGTAYCWGHNLHGEAGNGSALEIARPSPVCVRGGGASCEPLRDVIAISAGGTVFAYQPSGSWQPYDRWHGHTCAVRADGTVWCWGDNRFGQLGVGSVDVEDFGACDEHSDCPWPTSCDAGNCVYDVSSQPHAAPVFCGVPVPGICEVGDPLTGAVDVASGGKHTCALLEDGHIKCWGHNGAGQLGDGSTIDRIVPVDVPIFDALAVTTGHEHTCALRADNTIACWGQNANGQLGDGSSDNFRVSPIGVCREDSGFTCARLSGVVAVAAGRRQTCAVLEDGRARCWGSNFNGMLGDGTFYDRYLPTPVCAGGSATPTTCDNFTEFPCEEDEVLANVVAIDSGFEHTCALIADGTVRCWGRNYQAQLGVGQLTARWCTPAPPVCIPGSGVCGLGNHVDNLAIQSCEVAAVEVAP